MYRRSRSAAERRVTYQPVVVWLTGLPGAGKTTIARTVSDRLRAYTCPVIVLDGDELRQGVCADLGFSPPARHENIRRVGEMAFLLFRQGVVVLCALVSPYREDRDRIRQRLPPGRFLEVFVKADVEICRARDPKGLYAAAAGGRVQDLTGVSAPYEEPLAPELVIDTTAIAADAAADLVLDLLARRGFLDR